MGVAAPVLLYDSTCGFCADSVRFVLRHDRNGVLRFAPLDSAYGRAVIERHPGIRDIDSVLWVEPAGVRGVERVFARSAAAMRVASYLGGTWRLVQLAGIVPAPIRDAIYRLIARHRHRLSGRLQCFVPTAEERSRFLK
jgi:predicted DCC family thiol-disulfide oxidoreductase YuxK